MNVGIPTKLRSEAEFRRVWTMNRALEIYDGWCQQYDRLPRGYNLDTALAEARRGLNEMMGEPRERAA